MEITPLCVVALTWTLKDTSGNELDVLDEPTEFLLGGNDLLPKIEEALQGHAVGATIDVQLEPADAFGDYDAERVFLAQRSQLPENVEVGMVFEHLPPGIDDAAPAHFYVVTEMYPEHAVLDGNHPLAGMALRLHIQVRDVRSATAEEIEQGTAGAGSFSHNEAPPASGSALH